MKNLLAIQLVLTTILVGAQPAKVDSRRAMEELRILKTTLEEIHPDLYRYTSQAKFNATADSIAKSLESDFNPIELYLRFSPIVTQIKNGHTAIRLPKEVSDSLLVLPLRLVSFQGKVYAYKNLMSDDQWAVGREIERINNLPVAEIVHTAFPYVSVDGLSHSARFKAVVEDDLAFYYSLVYDGPDQFNISFADKESHAASEHNLNAITYAEFLSKVDQKEEFPWSLSRLDSVTVLLTIRSFANFAEYESRERSFQKTIEQFFRLISKWRIERLVLDLRFNGGGELKNSILLYSFFATDSFQFTKQLEVASISPPTYVEFTNYKEALKLSPLNFKTASKKADGVFEITDHFSQRVQHPKKGNFKGQLVVLVNGNTASAAGALVSCIKNDQRGLIVGEENRDNYTGFSAGVPVVLTLPYSGITVSIPLRKFTYAFGVDTGRGVVPDYHIASTADDFFNDKNAVLDFAIELLGK